MLGGLIQGTITGILALCAGIFTFYTFTNERRKHHHDDFLQWLTELTNIYQQNVQYTDVRMRLAKDRTGIRRMLACELLSDKLIDQRDYIDEDKQFFVDCENDYDKYLEWDFIKKFTDYLYFFEQILAFGISLRDSSSNRKSSELVNHFGWFLRSVCFVWAEGGEVDKAKAAILFIKYLCYNRYQRLTEVSLCFLFDHCYQSNAGSIGEELKKHFDECLKESRSIFIEKHHSTTFPKNMPCLQKKWIGLVGFVGVIEH